MLGGSSLLQIAMRCCQRSLPVAAISDKISTVRRDRLGFDINRMKDFRGALHF
jgi:hypothetical protein